MTEKKDIVHYYRKCLGYRRDADKLYDSHDDIAMCNAAFQLAMCGEFALNLLLALAGNDFVKTHNHRVLVRCCGEAGIKIPKEFRIITDDIYEFEAAGRYSADYNVDAETYNSVLYGLDKLLVMISQYYIKPLADTLREKLPGSMSAELTDTEMFIQYYTLM